MSHTPVGRSRAVYRLATATFAGGYVTSAVLAGYAWDRLEKRRLQDAVASFDSDQTELRPVAPEIRHLLEALIVDTVLGTGALRRQLASVRARAMTDEFAHQVQRQHPADDRQPGVPLAARWSTSFLRETLV